MKIALFSDVHANLPALEAMLTDMDSHKPDAVYCLGDLVGYNVWPNQVIAAIRQRQIATLMGNHDLKVQAAPLAQPSAQNYAYQLVDALHINYLNTLPSHIRLEYPNLNILMVHGSPRQVNEYVLHDTDQQQVLTMMQDARADVLIGGHSHKPYHRIIDAGGGVYSHVINIGSAGKPKDDNPKGCYVLLTLNETTSRNNAQSLQVEFIRFDYDIEKAALAILNSPLPAQLADMLRKGY
ncbi:putative phosphoesterase [Mucilaginibacter gracilis]|uniref:Putative phosphoesterase n=1 Tax=Mucilaginibacter gracilis TaxID=423350 RepID=A0A495J989_9SPHI|nr:metallophosphoesterase family protein [Mucilaginibacter gracilis]RKR84964.1 putative phosphoesterase [Mucilaginibacter gracilis]